MAVLQRLDKIGDMKNLSLQHANSQNNGFDISLLRRHDITAPRYTSYPTVQQFHEGFDRYNYEENARRSNVGKLSRPLSLYFHLPFCAHICYYCACNKIVTANRRRAQPYVAHLIRELRLHAELFDHRRQVLQLHWGGGTPTFLSPDLMTELMEATRAAFPLAGDSSGEYSIEIDPREASPDTIGLLRRLGFNRLSVGVQDLDPVVQAAVNRVQSFEQTADIVHAARAHHFRSVSVDLIYGLPCQTLAGFGRTLDRILELRPDRVVIFNYAHLPRRFKSQRRIDAQSLPSAEQKLAIQEHSIRQLTGAGYIHIGMDHFALPEDDLSRALCNGTLCRNFQGYSTHGDCDLVSMGITAIGRIGDSYSQNVRDLDEYYKRVSAGHIPIFRGMQLDFEDRLRRDVIMSLICNFGLDFRSLELAYNVDFKDFFHAELQQLQIMQDDGLLQLEPDNIRVSPAGRYLIRNICMVFDAYAKRHDASSFSRVV